MGHRSFGQKVGQAVVKKDDSSSSVEEEVGDIKEMSNGLVKVTDEQRRALEEGRRRIRDQVSAKMGELLLRGYTMLDAYCSICSGILMQDRQGNRECVQCELLRGELVSGTGASRIIGQIPLDASAAEQYGLALSDESDTASQSHSLANNPSQTSTASTARGSQLPNLNYHVQSTASLVQPPVDNTTSRRVNIRLKDANPENVKEFQDRLDEMDLNVSARSLLGKHAATTSSAQPQVFKSPAGLRKSPSFSHAQKTVEEKLMWCCDALNVTEDLERIIMLQKAIKGSIEILQMLK